jgi:hypothetical protein
MEKLLAFGIADVRRRSFGIAWRMLEPRTARCEAGLSYS